MSSIQSLCTVFIIMIFFSPTNLTSLRTSRMVHQATQENPHQKLIKELRNLLQKIDRYTKNISSENLQVNSKEFKKVVQKIYFIQRHYAHQLAAPQYVSIQESIQTFILIFAKYKLTLFAQEHKNSRAKLARFCR